MKKDDFRRLYPPLGDDGKAARQVVDLVLRLQPQALRCFCYVSGKDECCTLPILRYCLENGIPLAVPLCEGRGMMTARILTNLSQLSAGRYGIMEPPHDAPVMDGPAVTIVPGLAFDREGYRLGRGGGYYDRWLKDNACHTVGLCRPERLFECLPREEWDIPVKEVYSGG